MKAPGGLLSFVVPGRMRAATVMDSLQLVIHAVTFGRATICYAPATITHEHDTGRATAGIDDGLIRLSVGLENAEDIIADLDQALGKLWRGQARIACREG